jgi:hypothetical protein
LLEGITSTDIRRDPNLLGQFFGDNCWFAWNTIDKVISGLQLNEKELELYKQLSQRETLPQRVREFWAPIGRRGGKSRNAAFWAFKSAFFTHWSQVLPPGERGYVMMVYPGRRQGRVSLDYLRAFIDSNEMFRSMVERETKESIYLRNNIVLEIATCSFLSLRGYTIVTAICDELAFWRNEQSAIPDKEILTALRPAMATVPTSLLIGVVMDALASSKYQKNTIVIVWSDHGWHMGEKLKFHKDSAWSETTRIPLIIRNPDMMESKVCHRVVNLMDLYPSLIELCGLPERDMLEGRSLVPLLREPDLEWAYPSMTTMGRGSYTVNNEGWRHTKYSDGTEEPYDLKRDPNEWTNLIRSDNREAQEAKARLEKYIPETAAPGVPNNRVLASDVQPTQEERDYTMSDQFRPMDSLR